MIAQIRLSTRPDYIDEEILSYLKRYHVGTIELGVQSLDPEVLEASMRGHSVEDVYRSSKLIKEHGFELGIQTMTGMRKDTPQKDYETAEKVIGIGPSIVRIYPALVIRGTHLEKLYEKGLSRLKSWTRRLRYVQSFLGCTGKPVLTL
jgi:histone acetyltransferase (RNA polymerase elongator complex component)